MKIKNDKFEIKEVESEHLIAVAKFLCNENHGVYTEEEWLEKFDLFWELNPWFDKKKHCRGWAIFNYNQEVHGFLGNIPVVYLKDGKSEEAFWGTTWVVSKHARGQSLKLYNKFIEQKGSLFSTSTEPKIKEVNLATSIEEPPPNPITPVAFIFFPTSIAFKSVLIDGSASTS